LTQYFPFPVVFLACSAVVLYKWPKNVIN
jgi:hypothetical protein